MGQTLATSQWFMHGRKHFRQSGYSHHVQEYYGGTAATGSGTTTHTPSVSVQLRADIGRDVEGADSVDLTDKVVVVTG